MDSTKPRLGFVGGAGDFYSLLEGYERPPEIAVPEGHEGLFLEERTDLLKWSIIESPTTAQIIEFDGSGEPQWRPLLGEPNHVLAGLPITEPPRSRMLIVLEMVHYWYFWQDACAESDRPAPLLIENPDGQPITLVQFITEVHRYSVGLRDLLYEIEDREDSEHARLYCAGASGPLRKDAGDLDAMFRVEVISDLIDDGSAREERWIETARRIAKKHE